MTVSPEDAKPRRTWRYWLRTIGYWFFTFIVSFEMVAGSMWDLFQIEYVRGVFTRIGYPHYVLLILGVWKLPCAVVLLLPRLRVLKEWAYAGAFFTYSGAAASHALSGDTLTASIGPAVFGVLTLASWALRPPERRVATTAPHKQPSRLEWIAPIVMVAVMLALALATLPA